MSSLSSSSHVADHLTVVELEHAYRDLPVALCVTDADGGVFFINAELERLLRASGEKVIGDRTTPSELIRPYVSVGARAEHERKRSELEQTIYEDSLRLGEHLVLARSVRPLSLPSGETRAYAWSFRDVTNERRLEEMRKRLYDVSIFHSPDLNRLFGYVADLLATFYRATAVIGLIRDDFVEYRAVAGTEDTLDQLRGAPIEGAIERLPIEAGAPVQISDLRADERTKGLAVTRIGHRAYLGAPIISSDGEVVGAISLLDSQTAGRFDEEDIGFLSLISLRISADLERSTNRRNTANRAERQGVKDAQDLETTREVFESLNNALILAMEEEPATFLNSQAALLDNLLQFGPAAIVLFEGENGQPTLSSSMGTRIIEGDLRALTGIRDLSWLGRETSKRIAMPGGAELYAVPLSNQVRTFGAILFGAPSRFDVGELERTHLGGLADAISVILELTEMKRELTERNAALAMDQAQNLQAEKLASIGVLSATIAHDIKNVIAAISMELSIPGDAARTIANVRSHLDRFAVLSHRLLSYARPRMLVKGRVDLDDLIKRIANLLAPQLRISDIQLIYHPAQGSAVVMGDVHQIEHMLVSILVNSIQAMSAAFGGIIEITLKSIGDHVEFEIRDTGPGIEPTNLPRIFEPFFSTRHEGFGLGLYSARRIANEHGGDITARSSVGVGTALTVTLQSASDR